MADYPDRFPELLLLWPPNFSVKVRSLASGEIAPPVSERMPAYILSIFLFFFNHYFKLSVNEHMNITMTFPKDFGIYIFFK